MPEANKHGQCNIPEIPSNLEYVQANLGSVVETKPPFPGKMPPHVSVLARWVLSFVLTGQFNLVWKVSIMTNLSLWNPDKQRLHQTALAEKPSTYLGFPCVNVVYLVYQTFPKGSM